MYGFIRTFRSVGDWTRRIKLLIAVLILSCTGCITSKLENAQRLMNRPDFTEATLAAPEWVRDALLTINKLEHKLERK